jgi:RNA polymerase sigma-70 factor, ECF subfamily
MRVSWGYSYDDMPASADDDRSLARQAQSGGRAAFDELVRRYQKKVYRLAFGILRSTHDADDAVQEVFIRAYRYLPSLDPSRSFEGWLMGIAMNQARTIRGRRRVQPSETADVAVREKPARDAEMHTAALQAVSALPEKQREAMLLHLNTELTTQEIGEILGCSRGAAGVHLHRARATLRKALGPWLVLPSTP